MYSFHGSDTAVYGFSQSLCLISLCFVNFTTVSLFLKLCGNYLSFALKVGMSASALETSSQRSTSSHNNSFLHLKQQTDPKYLVSGLSSLKGTVEVPLLPDLVVTIMSSLSILACPTWHTVLPADIHSDVKRLLCPQIVKPMSNSLLEAPQATKVIRKKCCIIFECQIIVTIFQGTWLSSLHWAPRQGFPHFGKSMGISLVHPLGLYWVGTDVPTSVAFGFDFFLLPKRKWKTQAQVSQVWQMPKRPLHGDQFLLWVSPLT